MEDFVKGLVEALNANIITVDEAKALLEEYLRKERGLGMK